MIGPCVEDVNARRQTKAQLTIDNSVDVENGVRLGVRSLKYMALPT